MAIWKGTNISGEILPSVIAQVILLFTDGIQTALSKDTV